MKNVQFLGVTIVIDGHVDRSQYDLGAVTLTCEGRSYIVDICQSYTNQENGQTTIECDVQVDKEIFDETATKYDLQEEDFINPNLKGEIFIGNEYTDTPESLTLFVKIGEMTKAIDLESEC